MAPPDDLEHLKTRPVAELRRLWRQRCGGQEPPRSKHLLLRELAWQIQQPRHGGLDAATRTLLRSAVRQARAQPRGSSRGDSPAPPEAGGRARRRPRSQPQLQTGARLVRTWRGMPHEVTVLEEGKRFEYRGEVYRSLSQVAAIITGAHWSGPRFFGLHRVK